MAFKSASDYARELYAQFQQKAAPAVNSVVANIGNTVQNTVSQIKPINFAGVTQGINSVGKFIGQQPIINTPPLSLTPQIKSPTLLQTAQNVAPLIGGQKVNPTTSFLSGNIQRIPGQINKSLTDFAARPNPNETTQQYVQRTSPTLTGAVNFGFAKPAFAKAADYLAKTGDREAVRKISDFIIHVQKTGGKKNYGQLGEEIQAMATDIFGEKARTLDNKQLANLFDATLKSVGKKGKFGLGLGTENVHEGFSPTQQYINEQVAAQKASAKGESSGLLENIKSKLMDAKTNLYNSTAPIEDVLAQAQKKGKYQVLTSNNIQDQIDRAIRSPELSTQFMKDNGLIDAIQQAPDEKALNQYLIAKHATDVGELGIQTGRNAAKDKQLLTDLAPQYEPIAQKVVQYGQKLLDYATESGLVSKETATMLKQKYPNYVPLNRIFSELEQGSVQGTGRGVASLSKQTVVQRLKGSQRDIQNPLESLLLKTTDAFAQGERNQAGRMLASYKDLPGNPFQLKELKTGESATHTVSYLENGVKKTFETTPEIASAAKFLDKRQLGFIGNLFALPVRLARIGITGINLPFVASNIAKDQVSAFINSDKALQTSIANPPVFLKAAWNAIGHGKEYDNWIRSGGGGTSFDISRNALNKTVAQIRAGRSVGSNVAYTVTHSAALLRAVENIVNRGEETTRLQQYIGTKKSLLAEGRTPKDAEILAARASRENTVNFARSGDWGKALNSVFLYLNAGLRGSGLLLRNLKNRPVQTSAKIALSVLTPVATVTAWNLSDPRRKAAYDDIQDFEKDNNLVIIPPNPVKDPKTGKWNVIKVPFSQEIANLTVPMRKSIEGLNGYDGAGFGDFAKAILGSTTSLNVNNVNQLEGQFIPQAVKPGLEATLNKNLFTGQDVVPQYINGVPSKDLPPEEQVKPGTSGTARLVGKAINQSPLKVEQFVKSTAGGVGSQLLNLSDTGLAATGAIPKDQVGGQSIVQGLESRFQQATGGEQQNKEYQTINKYQQGQAQDTQKRKQAISKVANILLDPNEDRAKKVQLIQVLSKDKQLFGQVKDQIRDINLNVTSADKAVRGLNLKQRASYIKDKLQPLSRDDKRALVIQYIKKGILTKAVVKELVLQTKAK